MLKIGMLTKYKCRKYLHNHTGFALVRKQRRTFVWWTGRKAGKRAGLCVTISCLGLPNAGLFFLSFQAIILKASYKLSQQLGQLSQLVHYSTWCLLWFNEWHNSTHCCWRWQFNLQRHQRNRAKEAKYGSASYLHAPQAHHSVHTCWSNFLYRSADVSRGL